VRNAMVSCCAWLIASIKFTHFCTQSTTSIFTFVFFPPSYATTLFSRWFSSSISFSSQVWKLLIFVVWSSFANNSSATFLQPLTTRFYLWSSNVLWSWYVFLKHCNINNQHHQQSFSFFPSYLSQLTPPFCTHGLWNLRQSRQIFELFF
jgi:hypothetical protein